MKEHQFTDLFLLIGTNPLPNYAVLKYFISNNKNLKDVWLLYSEVTDQQDGTYKYAEKIVKVLNKELKDKLEIHYIALKSVENLSNILNTLKNNILDIDRDITNHSVHMNYTGGTKIMGVAAHLFIDDHFTNKSFSYISARTFTIYDDDGDSLSPFDLRKMINISLSELLDLHSFERINNEPDYSTYDLLLNKYFIQKIDKGTLKEFYDEYDRNLFTNKKGNLINDPKDFIANWSFKKPGKELLQINTLLDDEYKIFFNNDEAKTPLKKHFKHSIQYIDGGWFEHYFQKILLDSYISKSFCIYSDIEAIKSGWSKCFQLDSLIIKGYQLYGISITTESDIKLCKLKGFEVIQRSRQIGGDEAKAILLCLLDDAKRDELNKELIYDTGSKKDNILVLGQNDIKRSILIEKIKTFTE